MGTVEPAARDDDVGHSLATFRRTTWWALWGTVAGVLGIAVGAWLLDGDVPVPARILTGAATGAAIGGCGVLLQHRLAGRPPGSAGTVVAGCGLAAGAVPLALGNFGLWSLAPAAVISVLVLFLRARRAWVVLGVAAVLLPAVGFAAALGHAGVDGAELGHAAWMPLLMVAAFGPTMLGMVHAWQVAVRLDDARRLAGELAVADERLRFAAELHDVQGHHLQVIALKSELAARIAETDPASAAERMREVQGLAGDALRETRTLVQGYRRTTLEAEMSNASRVLAAAGVDTRVEVDPAAVERLAETDRGLLGLVVREATTNVLRHAKATTAAIALTAGGGHTHLSVTNDGAPQAPGPRPPGTGLVSLAERLDSAGGTLTWTHADGSFTVTATVDH